MKFLMMKIMLFTSSIIPLMKNPMSMGILLLIQTMIMTMFMNKMLMSSWFSMITFLMMMGGLLILFTYMSSIASNEKFMFNINLVMIFIMIMIIFSDEMILKDQIKENEMLLNSKTFEQMSMMKLYNKKSMFMSILMMIFLLFTMIVVTKIVKHFEGPLRKKTYE
uniref:NADH dehydrogenase subunit 6 n=1 Tax=Mileewa amplimacula TaxID=2545674 RepID=A0A977TM34_9HEMI|nr:NADH dehydrogenase subunit 6 [Mileewa amplimacula]UXX17576.1 NADH dehydrogenase subunit 6 [Mileewa amplimacula]